MLRFLPKDACSVRSAATPICSPPHAFRPRLLQDACRQMAEKLGTADPEDDSLCLSLNECLDGVTSACLRRARGGGRVI